MNLIIKRGKIKEVRLGLRKFSLIQLKKLFVIIKSLISGCKISGENCVIVVENKVLKSFCLFSTTLKFLSRLLKYDLNCRIII